MQNNPGWMVSERLGPTVPAMRHSCVQYNLEFHHSAWTYMFPIFSISCRCHTNTICKIVWHLLCTQRRTICNALLPDCGIIHYSPHWLLNMKHAFHFQPLLSPVQWSEAGMREYLRTYKRDRLYVFFKKEILRQYISRITAKGVSAVSMQTSLTHRFQQLLHG